MRQLEEAIRATFGREARVEVPEHGKKFAGSIVITPKQSLKPKVVKQVAERLGFTAHDLPTHVDISREGHVSFAGLVKNTFGRNQLVISYRTQEMRARLIDKLEENQKSKGVRKTTAVEARDMEFKRTDIPAIERQKLIELIDQIFKQHEIK